ncbi:hypothetical protein GLAREA_01657 [Glarea lozoyensis ATCC 20868]|uniref:Uncharacterized protein n=1 Tax=Glarea lozoyensis (strain ATCC 20868 / MF5171) TaxID=1116229 RepID=S3CIX5_GLAL2|nr:uncharacterized protein GLAREA_01657 [Glarea lozoyensis ATCC 20868]EPE25745.1 hypothetical protein GLAREA_01657 [Glarea lozoyensis ATCC 20868]
MTSTRETSPAFFTRVRSRFFSSSSEDVSSPPPYTSSDNSTRTSLLRSASQRQASRPSSSHRTNSAPSLPRSILSRSSSLRIVTPKHTLMPALPPERSAVPVIIEASTSPSSSDISSSTFDDTESRTPLSPASTIISEKPPPTPPPTSHPAFRNDTVAPSPSISPSQTPTPTPKTPCLVPTTPLSPPSISPLQSTPLFPLTPSITPQSIPQWLWTTHDCKTYLYQIFHTLLNNSPEVAYGKADRFEGFGPNMFSTTYAGWKSLYGAWEGDGIYSFIFVSRNMRGALPSGLTYEHFERVRKGGELEEEGEMKEKKVDEVQEIEAVERVG